MNTIYIIIALVLIIGIPISIFLIKAHLRWKKIKEKADNIKNEKIDSIISAIENIGECEPTAAILIKDKENQYSNQYSISIPSFISSPWSGRKIEFELSNQLPISIKDDSSINAIGNCIYRAIPAPRIKLKSGKEQNTWSVKRYLNRSPELKTIMSPIESADQEEALKYILGPTIRVLGGIQWAQSAEYPKCEECNGKMTFLLQVPGFLFPNKVEFDIHESEIYVFSCIKHQNNVQKVIQFY